jgi:hypothetical protein
MNFHIDDYSINLSFGYLFRFYMHRSNSDYRHCNNKSDSTCRLQWVVGSHNICSNIEYAGLMVFWLWAMADP